MTDYGACGGGDEELLDAAGHGARGREEAAVHLVRARVRVRVRVRVRLG